MSTKDKPEVNTQLNKLEPLIKTIKWVVQTEEGRIKALSLVYALCFGVLPWILGWQSYPLVVYLALAMAPVVPIVCIVLDGLTPNRVAIGLGIVATFLWLELVAASLSPQVFSTTMEITTSGVQGWSLIIMAVMLNFVARNYATE